MASGRSTSATSASSASSPSPRPSSSSAGPARPRGSKASGPSCKGVPAGPHAPTMLCMVVEALETLQLREQRHDLSVTAIKRYVAAGACRFKYLLRQALDSGLRRGLLVRPVNSKARGVTGSFKLVPDSKKKNQPRKKPGRLAESAGEAKKKGPPKPSQAQEPVSTGKVEGVARKPGDERKAPSKPAATRERAPPDGSQARGIQAEPGAAGKGPRKPDKAKRSPSGASRPRGEPTGMEGSSQGGAESHREPKTVIASSKPTAGKVKKAVAMVPRGAAAPGPREGPKAKEDIPPEARGSRTGLKPPARKTVALKGPVSSALPSKASASKLTKKKEGRGPELEAGS
ncbi:histone H1oo [Tupaia chinensis]|uniref:histone H1oo n=1 Tax=Tupaia chinensis TaxID=246437 RepID=UPI000703E8D2|nr:histone H1oo [Tupaia chinensis]